LSSALGVTLEDRPSISRNAAGVSRRCGRKPVEHSAIVLVRRLGNRLPHLRRGCPIRKERSEPVRRAGRGKIAVIGIEGQPLNSGRGDAVQDVASADDAVPDKSPGRGSPTFLGDITSVISEVVTVEQILIRNLPAGTKAALRARAEQHHRSVEAEVRDILGEALEREPVTLVDLLSTDEGADIEFEPERLGLTARTAEL
jgi:antitoxin FitA